MKNFSSKTKANFHHNSKKNSLRNIVLLVGAIVISLWLLGNVLGMASAAITKPIYAIRTWLAESTGTVPLYFRDRGELIETIVELEAKVTSYEGSVNAVERLSLENDELRSLVHGSDPDRIAAGVIARPPALPYDALLIDQGLRNGIEEGAVVFHSNDIAVGFVSRVFLTSALVTLFSTPGVVSTGYIYGPDIYTTIEGMGGGVLAVHVPQGIELSEGDLIVLPTLEAGIVGTINTIESKPTEPSQTGFVTSNVAVQSLRLVSVSTYPVGTISFEEAQEHIREQITQNFSIDVPENIIIKVATSTATSSEEINDENI